MSYDRTTGYPPRRRSIRGICGARDFYTRQTVSGEADYKLESDYFKKKDAAGDSLLSAILDNRSIPHSLVPRVPEHIAIQIVRTKWFRDYVYEKAPESWRTKLPIERAAAGPPPSLSGEEIEDFWDEVAAMPSEGWEVLDDENAIVDLPLGRSKTIEQYLLREFESTNFTIVWLPNREFVTSDNPVLLRDRNSSDFGTVMKIGLKNAVEIWFPLDPHHALLITRLNAQAPTIIGIPDSQLLKINTALAYGSDRWTIWRPDSVARQFVNLPNEGSAARRSQLRSKLSSSSRSSTASSSSVSGQP